MTNRTAQEVIAALGLVRHPEGGWYRQTWIADAPEGTRPSGTAILFLLAEGERSHWHRVDAAEVWLWHAGAPLVLSRAATEAGPAYDVTLGVALTYQAVVEPDHWQAAHTTGAWSLVSCTVSPGFRFEGFELAPPDFEIPR